MSSLRRQDAIARIAGVGLALPAFLVVVGFFVYPFFLTFTSSLHTKDGALSLGNYAEALDRFGGDVWYTLFVCVTSVVVVIVISAAIAGILRLTAFRLVEFLFTIPLFVPYVVVGQAMRVFLAPHGTLNSLLAILPFYDADALPSFVFGTFGLISAMVWKSLGLALLLVLGAYRGISEEFLDAARSVGAGSFRLIARFLAPMSLGTFGVVAILTLTSMLGNFSIPAMLDSGNGNAVLMIRLYDALHLERDPGLANAIGVITYVLSLGAAVYYLYSLRTRRA